MKAARSEDPGREIELPAPIIDDRTPEEAPRPPVHLTSDLLGDSQEYRIAREGQLQVALVVERHRRHLAERVLAVEHPAVRAGEERIRDVADAAFDWCARPGGRPGPLNPLAPQVFWDRAPCEVTVARVLNRDPCAWNDRVGSEERDPLVVACARRPSRDARGHYCVWLPVQRRQGLECGENLGREDVGISVFEVRAELQCCWHAAF